MPGEEESREVNGLRVVDMSCDEVIVAVLCAWRQTRWYLGGTREETVD